MGIAGITEWVSSEYALRKARIMLNQLESDYHIVPEEPIWKDM